MKLKGYANRFKDRKHFFIILFTRLKAYRVHFPMVDTAHLLKGGHISHTRTPPFIYYTDIISLF